MFTTAPGFCDCLLQLMSAEVATIMFLLNHTLTCEISNGRRPDLVDVDCEEQPEDTIIIEDDLVSTRPLSENHVDAIPPQVDLI